MLNEREGLLVERGEGKGRKSRASRELVASGRSQGHPSSSPRTGFSADRKWEIQHKKWVAWGFPSGRVTLAAACKECRMMIFVLIP